MHTVKTIVAVKGLILHKNRALIVQRSGTDRHSPGMWEFAGGKVEHGEQPVDGLKREIHEETGLSVNVERPLYASFFSTSPVREIILISYLCHAKTCNVTLSFEHQDFCWADNHTLHTMLDNRILHNLNKYHVFDQIHLQE